MTTYRQVVNLSKIRKNPNILGGTLTHQKLRA